MIYELIVIAFTKLLSFGVKTFITGEKYDMFKCRKQILFIIYFYEITKIQDVRKRICLAHLYLCCQYAKWVYLETYKVTKIKLKYFDQPYLSFPPPPLIFIERVHEVDLNVFHQQLLK